MDARALAKTERMPALHRLADRIGELWGALSRAGHHHHYELSPTAAELRGWLVEAQTLVTRLEEAGR